MKAVSGISILGLVLLGIWEGGCSAAKATQMPTSPPMLASAPTPTPAPSASPPAENELPLFEGEYLGQPEPGLTPEPFAPEIFAVDGHFGHQLHSSLIFSPDGKLVYFADQSMETLEVIPLQMKMENGVWSQPQVAALPSMPGVVTTFVFSSDWDRLYLYVDRALPSAGRSDRKVVGFWLAERTESGWSEARQIGSATNLDKDEGVIYFSADLQGGLQESDIHWVEFVGGGYTEPKKLGDNINTSAEENVSCVAPDDSYLIFYRFDEADKAKSGLFLSFHVPDGSWTEPVHLDERLGLDFGFDASLSPDGERLFLLDRGIGVYWVDAAVIEQFMPE